MSKTQCTYITTSNKQCSRIATINCYCKQHSELSKKCPKTTASEKEQTFFCQLTPTVMNKLLPFLDYLTLEKLTQFKDLQYLQDEKSLYWRVIYGKKFSLHLPQNNIKETYRLNCLLVNNCKNVKDLLYQVCKHNWEQMAKYLIDKISKDKTVLIIDKVSFIFINRNMEFSHTLVELFLSYFDSTQKTHIAQSLAKIEKVAENKELLHKLIREGAKISWMTENVKKAFDISVQ